MQLHSFSSFQKTVSLFFHRILPYMWMIMVSNHLFFWIYMKYFMLFLTRKKGKCIIEERHQWIWGVLIQEWSSASANLLFSSVTPELGRSPGEGKGYALQYSDLENSTACVVHGVTKSWTQLSDFHFHFSFSVTREKLAWRPLDNNKAKSMGIIW